MIEASAPVRVCDNGGWTDTWFGAPGRVFNIAVEPRVEVVVRRSSAQPGVLLDVVDFGDRYPVVPRAPRNSRHPLLEAAIDALPPPPGVAVEIHVSSVVPPGSSTGTSAAVAVSLLGALAAVRGEELRPRQAAYAAHHLEVDVLGGECGIQDQLSVAFGGVNFFEIEPYPEARVTALPVWRALDSLLTLVYLGRAHDSSGVHRQVIERVARHGPEVFAPLRAAAGAARDALVARDLVGFGRSLIANTEAQSSLHPDLVGSAARRVIEVARALGCVGWKVNGAGGEGGSVTVLSATDGDRSSFERELRRIHPGYRLVPIRISSDGLRVRGGL